MFFAFTKHGNQDHGRRRPTPSPVCLAAPDRPDAPLVRHRTGHRLGCGGALLRCAHLVAADAAGGGLWVGPAGGLGVFAPPMEVSSYSSRLCSRAGLVALAPAVEQS